MGCRMRVGDDDDKTGLGQARIDQDLVAHPAIDIHEVTDLLLATEFTELFLDRCLT